MSTSTFALNIKKTPPPIPPGMKSVEIGIPFQTPILNEIKALGAKKVFVLSNNSSRQFLEGEGKLIEALKAEGILACPLNSSVKMGGAEEGLLVACDEAYDNDIDCVVTVGGGAVQDAGKFIRLWLTTRSNNSLDEGEKKATIRDLLAAQKQDPMPALPPQIACPNSFAMAEASYVAGLETSAKTKSGAAIPVLMPTTVIYDPALSEGLPEWVRFGTALRAVEHTTGAVCHPKADDDVREQALRGLELLKDGINVMLKDPESEEAQSNIYLGGWIGIRALNKGKGLNNVQSHFSLKYFFLNLVTSICFYIFISSGCYPALGHLIQNHYSSKFNVHQGSCSGILSARILHYHYSETKSYQNRISAALGEANTPAYILVTKLVSQLPGVAKDHEEVGVTPEKLEYFASWMFDNHIARLNMLSPKKFETAKDILDMIAFPLDKMV